MSDLFGNHVDGVLTRRLIYFEIYPYMGNVEENEDVNCCASFAFKYIFEAAKDGV